MPQKCSIIVITLFLFLGCARISEQRKETTSPKIIKAHEDTILALGASRPVTVRAKLPTVVKAGKPAIKRTYSKIVTATIKEQIKLTRIPARKVNQDTFLSVKSVPINDSPFIAGIPEDVVANDAGIKEQNSQSFSFFSKLQGLKNVRVTDILQDGFGNLWFATWGGITKFDGKSFTHITQTQGLISNAVSSIILDKKGNLWIGKVNTGISKYDGKFLTNYTIKDGLTSNRITNITEDKKGNLWFCTEGGGVNKFDGKQFTSITESDGLCSNTVNCSIEDKEGALWFGTSKGLCKYDGVSLFNYTANAGPLSKAILSMLEDKEGNLWLGCDGGVIAEYDGTTFTIFSNQDGVGSRNIKSIMEDRAGNLWFGLDEGGVSKFDGKTFTNFSDKEGLSDNTVLSMLEDEHGDLWFGTYNGGVNKFSGKRFTHFTVAEGLSNNNVRSILEDRTGNLWFGTNGGGVTKYDRKSFFHFTNVHGLNSNLVSCMLEDRSGNLWFGYWGAGVSKYDGKTFRKYTVREGLPNNIVTSIVEDRGGNIWFGCLGGVSKFDSKSFTNYAGFEGFDEAVLRMMVDKKGNVWIASAGGGGVIKFDGKNFIRFTKREGLNNNFIRNVLEDSRGNIWFATLGGITRYDGINFMNLTEKQGLVNDDVWTIAEDRTGNIWFGTATGLSKLEKGRLALYMKTDMDKKGVDLPLFKNYTYEDGFFGLGVNGGNTIYEDKEGTMWIGAFDRLTSFHPDEEELNDTDFIIQLTDVTLFNDKIDWQSLVRFRDGGTKDTNIELGNGMLIHDLRFESVSNWYGVPKNLSLAHDNNYLTFHFVGITMHSPRKVKYRYKLDGIDENWSSLTSRAEASYGNIPPGQYLFKVKAMNADGYWSREYTYSFTVRPPWWNTWWAYTFFALLFVVLIFAFFRFRMNKIRMQHELDLQQHKAARLEIENQQSLLNERLRISRELHDDMGSTLGSISIYSEVAKNQAQQLENTEEVLSKIGLVSRELIDKMSDIVWSSNPTYDSFEQLEYRMATFARMMLTARDIKHDFVSDDELKNVQFTAEQRKNIFLIFKEAVYNIAKYAHCTRVNIEMKIEDNTFQMLISDNGKGFDTSQTTVPQPSGGNGIKNMNTRASSMNAKLFISSKMNVGSSVHLTLKL